MLLLPTVGRQARDTVSRSGYLYYNPDCIRVASTCGFRVTPKERSITEVEMLSASRTLEVRGRHLSLVFLAPSGSRSGSIGQTHDGKPRWTRRSESESIDMDMAKRCLWVAG
jgi:hypothetical protein